MAQRLDHEPPPWVTRESTYLITACAYHRLRNVFCHAEIGEAVLDSILVRNEKQIWYCELAVLMPDHIHLILSFPEVSPIPRVIRHWKGWLAKTQGICWQKNFFDHRLRNEEEISRKAEYSWMNPVRGGLIKRAEDWPYTWLAKEFLPRVATSARR